jgi:hypothetical protein
MQGVCISVPGAVASGWGPLRSSVAVATDTHVMRQLPESQQEIVLFNWLALPAPSQKKKGTHFELTHAPRIAI